MGLFFTLLYIATAYLTPPVLFGPLGLYHIEIILAFPTILCSLLAIQDSEVGSFGQTWAAFGMMIAVFMSMAATGWIGGAPKVLLDFLPNILVFFFVMINCRKKIHLQLLIGMLFCIVVFVIIQSQIAEKTAVAVESGNVMNNYYIFMKSDTGDVFFRIQGLGVIGDPNDFGQFMLGLLPCLFFFWAKGKALLNLVRVYIPVAVTLFGVYLTHSRGAMLALAACTVMSFRRKLGLIPSAIGAAFLLVGLMAAGFTGGRDVSASAGEDRMGAWSVGLNLIKTHPLFGVGYYHFTDYYYITAHNTIVVCAAEIGMLGFFFWVLFTFSGMRDAFTVGNWGRKEEKAKKDALKAYVGPYAMQREAQPSLPELAFAGSGFAAQPAHPMLLERAGARESSVLIRPGAALQSPGAAQLVMPGGPAAFGRAREPVTLPPEEIRRLAGLVLVSFVGLLTTGWFLSRAFAMVFFIYGGVSAVIFRMARERGMEVPRLPLGRAFKLSIAPTILLLMVVYIILRLDHLFPH